MMQFVRLHYVSLAHSTLSGDDAGGSPRRSCRDRAFQLRKSSDGRRDGSLPEMHFQPGVTGNLIWPSFCHLLEARTSDTRIDEGKDERPWPSATLSLPTPNLPISKTVAKQSLEPLRPQLAQCCPFACPASWPSPAPSPPPSNARGGSQRIGRSGTSEQHRARRQRAFAL